ncbi:MAG: ATP-dependent Clp protease proteolytic subunit [Pirellulaceae bacterium]
MARQKQHEEPEEGPLEIAVIGDLTEQEGELHEKLLEAGEGGQCTLYFDSPGGSAYAAISLLSLISLRRLDATGIVTGECSSAALWPLAACRRRIVTPYSVLRFHTAKWESEENVGVEEAAEWARHFVELEKEMDELLATFLGISEEQLAAWMKPGRYVSGREFAEAGLAEMLTLSPRA